jgi:UDP-N-acetylglucosamine--N-acetylmuramyl-(pentapeptide) pyrophosphoryl-undecaprenol N-acetylglucosamine transferase
MRIYFGVNGVGLGHIGRCIPIAMKLIEAGDTILFSTYSDACSYVERENLPLCQAPPISYVVKPDGEIDFRQTTANPGVFSLFIFLNQLRAEIRFMRGFNPDVIVSDSRVSTILAAKLLEIPVFTLLNIYRVKIPRERRFLQLATIADGGILTIIGKIWRMGEKILIPDFPLPYTISAYNVNTFPSREKKIQFIGPIIPIKPKELPDRKVIRKKLGLDDEYLILAPISGPSQEKMYFSETIRRILKKLPNKYHIIMSLGLPQSNAPPTHEGNMLVYDWLPNRFEVLKACDLVISRAGLGTITHALCYGKPLILIPTPSQTEQLGNAKRVAELGVAKIIDQRSLSYSHLYSTLRDLFLGSFVERAHQIQRNTAKYDAVETVVELIKK